MENRILLRTKAVAYSRHSASVGDGKRAEATYEVWERKALPLPRPRSSGPTFRLRMNANMLRGQYSGLRRVSEDVADRVKAGIKLQRKLKKAWGSHGF